MLSQNNRMDEQLNNDNPGDAINRIVRGLSNGGGNAFSNQDLFGPGAIDDRRLFTTTVEHNNNNNGNETEQQSTEQLKEEFQSLRLLTQYIGPARKPPPSAPDAAASGSGGQDQTIQEMEARRLKDIFLEKTDRIDKMQSHHEALQRAVARDRIPAKLKIQAKPLVAEGECPKLLKKWTECVKDAERNMVKVLTDHLEDKIEVLNNQIRDTTEKTFLKLRATANLNTAQTTHLLNHTLGEAEKERKARSDERKRRRMEQNPNQQQQQRNKRPRKD